MAAFLAAFCLGSLPGQPVTGNSPAGSGASKQGDSSWGGPPWISPGRRGENGWQAHTVRSEFQEGETEIQVLTPSGRGPKRRYAALYILPVEAGNGTRWGNALPEVRRWDLAERFQLICVYPTFSALPWYADHPSRSTLRQESYFLQVVVPFIEKNYPVRKEAAGRLLVGFSKSGWGAFSLLLRHPGRFGRAAAWDAPLAMEYPDRYGMEDIFGDQRNFEAYCISRLLQSKPVEFSAGERLIHMGFGNFRDQHTKIENLMQNLHISHLFRDGPRREHSWNSGWLPEAVELLCQNPGGP